MTLIARARLASLLARGFAYPTVEILHAIKTGAYAADATSLAGALGLQVEAGTVARAIAEDDLTDPTTLEGEYTRLFERTVLCPLNGSGYALGDGMGAVHDMARVASFYGAFGFKVSPQAKELADHLCVELEFLGVLCAKEAYAIERGWEDKARIASAARATYVRDHLAPWLPKLAARLEQHARLKFYPALAGLGQGLVSLEPVPVAKDGGAT